MSARRLDSFIRSNGLPVRIKALSGCCGIDEGDYLDLHFAKNTKMVEMVSGDGKRYLLPLCSSLNCGVLYNPELNLDKAIDGYRFGSVSQLMEATPLPAMICVENGFFHEKTTTGLDPEEVLAISCRTQTALVCTEINTLATKNIGREFDCSFATAPKLLFMPISEFINQIELPATVVFESLLKNGRKDMYTITNVFTMQSVVGQMFKYQVTDRNEINEIRLIELFLDVPLKFKVEDCNAALLDRNAHTTYEMFKPSIGCKFLLNNMVYGEDDIQRLLLSCISLDKWDTFVQLFPPDQNKPSCTNRASKLCIKMIVMVYISFSFITAVEHNYYFNNYFMHCVGVNQPPKVAKLRTSYVEENVHLYGNISHK